jgi:hypothetical protein
MARTSTSVRQPEKFIPHSVPSSINPKLRGNVDEVQLTTSSTQMYYNEFDEFGIIVFKNFIIIFMLFFLQIWMTKNYI